jgi:hypothetical protein
MSELLDLTTSPEDMIFELYAAVEQSAAERFGVKPQELKPFAQEYYQEDPLDATGSDFGSSLTEQTKIRLDLNLVADAPGDIPDPIFNLRFEHAVPVTVETVVPQVFPKAVAAFIFGYPEEFEELYRSVRKKSFKGAVFPKFRGINPFEFGTQYPELAKIICAELSENFADTAVPSLLHEVVSQEYTMTLTRTRALLAHTEDHTFRAQEKEVGIFNVAHINGYLDDRLTFHEPFTDVSNDAALDRRTAKLTKKALKAIISKDFDEDEAADRIVREDVQTAYRLLRAWLWPQKHLSY